MWQKRAAAAVGAAGLGLALMVVKDFHQQAQVWDQILSVSTKPVSGLGHQGQQGMGSPSSQGELDSACVSHLWGSVHSAALSSCPAAAPGFDPA